MSYDYNALVASIAAHRRQAMQDSDNAATHLQQAVDTFATLSSHCPMTPLLWMQYAHDTKVLLQLLLADEPQQQATEMQLSTLELGIAEFPGCALLRLHYLQLLMEDTSGANAEKVESAFQEALAAVARGSHRNEGHFVAAIYRLYTEFLVKQQKPVLDVFVQRAKTPMKDANDGLVNEAKDFYQTHNLEPLSSSDLERIESARRWTAKTFDSFVVNEDDVDVAMHAEGILSRHTYSHEDINWETLVKSEAGRLWMGFGGAQTAAAFLKYAQACSYYKVPRHEFEADEKESKEKLQLLHSLALCVYERGVAECPTAESLWLAYIRQLTYLISVKSPLVSVSRLESVVSRAARNCPYSVQILQEQIKTALVMAQAGQTVFDPDSLTTLVDNAIQSKFLPNPASQLELYTTAIQTIKRRILSLLSGSSDDDTDGKYDGAVEQNGKKKKNTTVDDEFELGENVEQEIQDLVEDLRDVYDTADSFLRKSHSSWTEGRTRLWKDRAMTETYLLGPLCASLENGQEKSTGEGLRCFDKLVKVHQPPHPDSYSLYIREFMNQPVSTPRQVLRNLQTARFLFQKALKTVGKPKDTVEPSSVSQRDRATALQSLCQDYLEFEQLFGSDDSYAQAFKAVKKKFEGLVMNGNHTEEGKDGVIVAESNGTMVDTSTGSKRGRPEDISVSDEPVSKKPKTAVSIKDVEMKDAAETDEKSSTAQVKPVAEMPTKHTIHKVRVGKLNYPAHPFTVRVTNLATETEDMDLVDLFRPKCGNVVHAKIVRDKNHRHGKAKSKGWGLVQFEERDSVDKALQLNDVIGIHEHVVKVDRSHVPAVGLVPPGMHRVKPRGEGKSSKRNQKQRERKMSRDETHTDALSKKDGGGGDTVSKDEGERNEEAPKSKTSSNASILAFRPRGVSVAHGSAHRKVKLSLGSKESKDNS